MRNDRHFRMVDQVFAHARQIGNGSGIPCAFSCVARADAGEHEKLRRDERARRQDDLALGVGLPLSTRAVAIGDAHGHAVLDLDAADPRIEFQRQVLGRSASGAMKA